MDLRGDGTGQHVGHRLIALFLSDGIALPLAAIIAAKGGVSLSGTHQLHQKPVNARPFVAFREIISL